MFPISAFGEQEFPADPSLAVCCDVKFPPHILFEYFCLYFVFIKLMLMIIFQLRPESASRTASLCEPTAWAAARGRPRSNARASSLRSEDSSSPGNGSARRNRTSSRPPLDVSINDNKWNYLPQISISRISFIVGSFLKLTSINTGKKKFRTCEIWLNSRTIIQKQKQNRNWVVSGSTVLIEINFMLYKFKTENLD